MAYLHCVYCGLNATDFDRKHLWISFTRDKRRKRKTDRWIGAAVAVMWTRYRSVVVKRAEFKSEALILPVDRHLYPDLWSRAVDCDRKDEIADTSDG